MMCHCDNDVPCDRFTGVCPGPCSQGWLGTSCQTGLSISLMMLIVSYSYFNFSAFSLVALSQNYRLKTILLNWFYFWGLYLPILMQTL